MTEARNRAPRWTELDKTLDILHQLQHAPDRALQSAETWLMEAPGALSLHCLGMVHAQMGNYAKARPYFEQAVVGAPQVSSFHSSLAQCLRHLQLYEQAERHYKAAIDLEPLKAHHRNNLGSLYYRQGQLKAARQLFEKALRMQADYIDAHFNLAQCLMQAFQLLEARPHYQAVLKARPGDAVCHMNLALSFIEEGQYRKAQHHLEACLQAQPDDPDAHYQLGNVHLELNDIDEARAHYLQACQLRDYPQAHHNLAILALRQDQRPVAHHHFTQALQLDPSNVSARHMLASLEGRISPPPLSHVTDLFDQYAPHYNEHMKHALHYQGAHALRNLFASALGLHHSIREVLDLGCGTGLAARQFRDLAFRLTGVDISKAMLAEARASGIFDELVEQDIISYLDQCQAKFDLIIAADVLSYLGPLEHFFEQCARILTPGQWLGFSIERAELSPYQLKPSGRFAHHSAYIETLADTHGFSIRVFEDSILRTQAAQPVDGFIYALQRS